MQFMFFMSKTINKNPCLQASVIQLLLTYGPLLQKRDNVWTTSSKRSQDSDSFSQHLPMFCHSTGFSIVLELLATAVLPYKQKNVFIFRQTQNCPNFLKSLVSAYLALLSLSCSIRKIFTSQPSCRQKGARGPVVRSRCFSQ